MKFKPMLACNESVDLDKISYPKYASMKLDGIRCVFHPELGMVSRSLKPIQNKQLQVKFKYMIEKSKKENRFFDGELYGHNRTFQEITRACMTKDFCEQKTVNKLLKEKGENTIQYIKDLISDMKFYCFDTYFDGINERFMDKITIINVVQNDLSIHDNTYISVTQAVVNSKEDVEKFFEVALKEGYEGLILRNPDSPYKFGRSTLKEEYMLKVKPFKSFDAQIIDVIQGTEVDPKAEKKINELGRSVTSRKKDDRVLVDKAAAFLVTYEHHTLKVSLAMTDEEKEEIWNNKMNYIGRMIEYKGMMIGAKDVPRHPVFVRFREDCD